MSRVFVTMEDTDALLLGIQLRAMTPLIPAIPALAEIRVKIMQLGDALISAASNKPPAEALAMINAVAAKITAMAPPAAVVDDEEALS